MRNLLLALAYLAIATLLHVWAGAPLHGQQLEWYTADWCGPCQRIAPRVEQLARQGVTVRKVDCTHGSPPGITRVPTFRLVDASGNLVEEWIGTLPESEILSLWANSKPSPGLPSPQQMQLRPSPNDANREGEGGETRDGGDWRRMTPADIRVLWAGGHGSGTAVARTTDGGTAIVTNYHVVQGASGPVQVINGENQALMGVVTATDPANDLAIIEVPTAWRYVNLAAAGQQLQGARVHARGFAQGQTFTVHGGQVTNAGSLTHDDRTQSPCLIATMEGGFPSGCSGGGVYADGELVGVLFATDLDNAAVIQFTPIDPVRRLLEQKCYRPRRVNWSAGPPVRVQSPAPSPQPQSSGCRCDPRLTRLESQVAELGELRQSVATVAKLAVDLDKSIDQRIDARVDQQVGQQVTQQIAALPPATCEPPDLSDVYARLEALEQKPACDHSQELQALRDRIEELQGQAAAPRGKLYLKVAPHQPSGEK